MYHVDIITPCSRPHFLVEISESINKVFRENYFWHIVLDSSVNISLIPSINRSLEKNISNYSFYINSDRGNVGHGHRNFLLKKLYANHVDVTGLNRWIYFIDDDNILHPELKNYLQEFEKESPAIIVNQCYKDGNLRYSDGEPRVLMTACKENMKVFFVDTAQAFFNLKYIKNCYWEKEAYNADGKFITRLFQSHKNFNFIDKNLSYYNYLTS